jgi:hypothetical protein
MNKKVIISMLVISVLLFSNVLAITQTAMNTSTPFFQKSKTSNTPVSEGNRGLVNLLEENFSGEVIPPAGWTLVQTNPDETWEIDCSLPYSEPCCAGIHRGSSLGLQNEWLITPQLNFTNYNSINLSFFWYTSCYIAHWKDYIDLNVSISTDNGSTWTLLWSDDYIPGNYTSWMWIDTNMGNPIDISAYSGNSQVKIGFQYYSDISDLATYQELSIDDIFVFAESIINPLNCSAGGPYEWCWDNQHNYFPAGVRFHGEINEPQWWKCKWFWDFGDNSTSTTPFTPIHDYKDIGVYNITLRVIDNSTSPHRITFDHTTVRIFLMPAPEIDIQMSTFAWGIQATIRNDGTYNATLINWTMVARWGIMQERKVANGTIEKVGPNEISIPMKSGYFLKFGMMRVEISALPENIPGLNKEFNALKIGPFVLHIER